MIELRGVNKFYQLNSKKFIALENINLNILQGEFVAVTGFSGSGKSTLLSILGCLDKPSEGQYLLGGQEINNADDYLLSKIRNRKIGFVFQSFHLIQGYDALRNVELPMVYAGTPANLRKQRAILALKAVGLEQRMKHKPSELSGGQQQRVAIARAIVNRPDIIIADEPTGSLDDSATEEIMHLFRQLHHSGKTIIFVTHNMALLSYASRVIRLEQGQIIN